MTQSDQKKVIISGVSGQDGSYMVDYLLANTTHLIYGMVRRTAKPDYSNLEKALSNPRFQLVVGDLSDSQSIDNLVRRIKPDYFINLAAQSYVGSSWDLVEMTLDTTGIGLARILESVRRHVPQCRVYSAGSSEQWGDVAYSPQDEKHPMRPRSPYGCAKCLASHLAKVYRESYGLYVVHAILTNHESERRGHEFVTRKITLGVARIAKAIKEGKPFDPIELGNLDAKRDWSHAEDFVEGMWRMLHQEEHRETMRGVLPQHLSRCLEEYVLASGESHTVRDFVNRAFWAAGFYSIDWSMPLGAIGPESEVGYADGHLVIRINPEHYRPADVEQLLGDSTRARTELNWSPKVSFDQLVERMVRNDLAAVGL